MTDDYVFICAHISMMVITFNKSAIAFLQVRTNKPGDTSQMLPECGTQH